MLRELFPQITLEAEDLLLLEAFQIQYLPERLARKEFATLLREYPVIHNFLVLKYPPVKSFLESLLDEHAPLTEKNQVKKHCQEALWEIADLIIYNKYPELYDEHSGIQWDINEITSITPLEGKTVADVGAGSGRIAFLVAPSAKAVFAIEPITSFRAFIKEKALMQKVQNLFIMDGTLDSIPLPDNSLDVLLTSNAIGWDLTEELKEIERVVKPGGAAVHLLHSDSQQDNPYDDILTSSPWKYQCVRDTKGDKSKIRYIKVMSV